MVSPNYSVAAVERGDAQCPLHNPASLLPAPRASVDWPADDDEDDQEAAEPDADFDDSSLDDFDFELDDEPDPEPGDFWGDVDDEEF